MTPRYIKFAESPCALPLLAILLMLLIFFSEYSSGERIIKGHITKHGPSLLRFFLVETVQSLIKYTKKFRSKYLSIVRRLGKKRSIIAIARILAETVYTMLKNNVKFVDQERKWQTLMNYTSKGLKNYH